MTGGLGPSCDRGNGGGGGSSLSSCQLLCPSQLPSQLPFAREPERGAGGGVGGGRADGRRRRCWLLALCGDGSDSKRFLSPQTVSWDHLFEIVGPSEPYGSGGMFVVGVHS